MTPLPPAGWHEDPDDPRQWRYWDGSRWTEHRAPRTTVPDQTAHRLVEPTAPAAGEAATRQPSYFVPEGNFAWPQVMAKIAPGIPGGETIRVAVGATRFELGSTTLPMAYVVITDQAIHAAKERLLGSPRVDITVPLDRIREYGAGPLHGVGPTWSVSFRTPAPGFFYLNDGADAERIAEILGRSIGGLRDPDLDDLNRALDASSAAPPGDAGKGMTPAQVSEEVANLRALVASGRLQEAWDRRVVLGYGVPDDGVSQADRFWINADPAIAALRLGHKAHPMVAMCCGVAESDVDRSDPEQVHAVELFTHLYHGTGAP